MGKREREKGTNGGGGPRDTRSAALSTAGPLYTARLLVTVTVHLHSDLLNNAGIIPRGKKKKKEDTGVHLGRPRPRGASAGVFTRLFDRACLHLHSLS